MCGIAGIVSLEGTPPEHFMLARMCERLTHRGPDGEGFVVRGRGALGQRRLSIIDLPGGRQPMSNEDGTVWVTFNGEIYNFRELRQQLEQLGHRFATQSDTETIVHAYEQYGSDCVRRLRGMFAFGVWDEKRQTLLLARDRVGKKPLFYTTAGGCFLFASELQALLQHPAVSREPDHTAIDDYLAYGYVPAPRTGFSGICKLLPAHTLRLQLGDGAPPARDLRQERYWQLRYTPKLDLDEEAAAQELLDLLTDAVRVRLVADVPLGALLSGGVDSSLVVALMSRLSDRPVRTFSIGFDDQGFNELPYARLVAKRYGTDHHELIVRPDALSILPTLVRHYGEPFADSSAIPSYYVARLTQRHVKVALNGDGGDESFAGYERYLGARLADRYQRIPAFLRSGLIEPLASFIPESLPRRNRLRMAKRFLRVASQPFGQRYLKWVTYFTPEQKRELYTPEYQRELAGHAAEDWLLQRFDGLGQAPEERLDAVLAADIDSYLPYDLLVKMDIATMANSLEARSPLLDHKVLEFAARLPGRYKVRGATLKYLLKKVGTALLPPVNLRRRKMGFGVPLADWLRNQLRPLLEDVLLSPQARARGYFRQSAVRELVHRHVDQGEDRSPQLWSLLWLEMWYREFSL
jgi:asparagine synthase (glutamine-hydrolysing)